jgi:hypothetical protein
MFLGAAEASAKASTIVADGVVCTLSAAIQAANTNTPVGGCPAGESLGTDVIDLRVDVTIDLFDNMDANGCPNGLPAVTSRIAIYGHSHIVRALGGFRLFDSTQGNLTLDHITVRDGSVEFCRGGGINGVVTLIDSTVTNNFSLDRGAGVAGTSVRLIRSAVTDNRGSGVFVEGTLQVYGSRIAGNKGSGFNFTNTAGGIEVHGTAVIENTTVANNIIGGTSGIGGGIYADGDITITSSTISGNIATGDLAIGGGIFLYSGTLMIVNSTVASNLAHDPSFASFGGSGGGVFSSNAGGPITGPGGAVTIIHSTITGNSALGNGLGPNAGLGGGVRVDSLVLSNSIIANNTATIADGADCTAQTVQFKGVNLIGDGSCFAEAEGQLIGDPMLTPLADNGGPTLTKMPRAGSPVIDRIPKVGGRCQGAAGIRDDQRGVKRPQKGGGCDIGAVEVDSETLLPQLSRVNGQYFPTAE